MQEMSKFGLAPNNFDQALKYADLIAKSDLAPPNYKGKPENVLIAVQMGAEVGLAPMQSIQNIAVINGRPSIWGDAALALVKVHPHFISIREWQEGKISECNAISYCEIKRMNEPATLRSFSYEQAKRAGLINKAGTWSQYPERMLQMRARGFAIRDSFPDALKGLSVAEDIMDTLNEKYSSQKNNKSESLMELCDSIDGKKIELLDNFNPTEADTIVSDRTKKALDFYSKKGIKENKILSYFGLESIIDINEEHLNHLSKIKSSIKEGKLTFENAFSLSDIDTGEVESPHIEDLNNLLEK